MYIANRTINYAHFQAETILLISHIQETGHYLGQSCVLFIYINLYIYYIYAFMNLGQTFYQPMLILDLGLHILTVVAIEMRMYLIYLPIVTQQTCMSCLTRPEIQTKFIGLGQIFFPHNSISLPCLQEQTLHCHIHLSLASQVLLAQFQDCLWFVYHREWPCY